MFKRIMVPIDLSHTGQQEKALKCAAELALQNNATTVYVGVSAAAPSSLAHTPSEFAQKLEAFAIAEAKKYGMATEAHALTSHDPRIDLDPTLMKAVADTQADLVVMASHIPGVTDYIWPSNGGTLASHAPVSVMIVR